MIHRCVHHQYRDGYVYNPVLLGGDSRRAEIGFMGWQKGRNFKGVLDNFYTKQLPYRYLMHFGINNIYENKIEFEKAVTSSIVDDMNIITSNGITIKKGNDIFIPWNPIEENKIYHYSKNGGKTSWNLPLSLVDIKNLKVYKLTSN